jgi:effector-binding domain-containing protein
MVINDYAPAIKQVKPINFIFFRTETTIGELANFLSVATELFKEAFEKNLLVTGPVHWHYLGFTGDVKKPFTLEISLPVSEVLADYDGRFHFKRTETFHCVSIVHEGNWLEIPKGYDKLIQFAAKRNLEPVGVNRELYINADFNDPEANITELQMGVI